MGAKFLVLGATGQVGSALNAILDDVVVLGREQADFSNPASLAAVVENIRPQILINAVAYTQVDKAESERDLAFAVNAEAPAVLAQIAAKLEIPFVHYSTDYVFNGSGEKAWDEDDATAPLNIYGESKRAGELAVQAAGGKYLIFRTSWVYDAVGKNFFNTMLRLGREREQLSVVADQFGAPTYAPHLAAATLPAIVALQNNTELSGIYHLCGGGETSWYGFAEAIFAEAKARGVELKIKELLPINSDAYPTPAKRPTNSRMNCEKARKLLGISLPDWHLGLQDAFSIIA